MGTQTILTSLGAAEFTFPVTITDTNDHDISAATVEISLGTSTASSDTWVAPSVDEPQTDHATRVVQLYIDDTIDAGDYWLWVRVTDSPEIAPRRALHVVVA